MVPPILITGATGLVGNNVLRQLLELRRPVRVLVREGSDARPLEGLNVELARGDVRDRESVLAACRGVRSVIHAAGYVHLGRTQLDLHRAINVDGTRHVAIAAAAEGARLVHVSSCDAVGVRSLQEPADEETPLAPPVPCSYVITKREAEEAVFAEHEKGLDAVVVNPAFMLGPWDWKPSSGRVLLEVGRGRGLLAPRGTFSVCDVRDVAAGVIAALDKGRPGQRYILAGETMSYLDAFRLFAQVAGKRPPWGRPGPVNFWIGGKLGDLFGRLTGHEPVLNSGLVALARLPKFYSSRKAEAELGYHHRPVIETVQDAWNWFRSHGYV